MSKSLDAGQTNREQHETERCKVAPDGSRSGNEGYCSECDQESGHTHEGWPSWHGNNVHISFEENLGTRHFALHGEERKHDSRRRKHNQIVEWTILRNRRPGFVVLQPCHLAQASEKCRNGMVRNDEDC
jgi:hypothetical protein